MCPSSSQCFCVASLLSHSFTRSHQSSISISQRSTPIIQYLRSVILLSSHRVIFLERFRSQVFCFHFMFLCLLFSVPRLLNFIPPIPPRQTSPLHPPIATRTHNRMTFTQTISYCTSSKTGRSVPSAPPQDIACTSPTSTSLLVSWAPPPVEFQNGIIMGYTIQYSTTEGNKTSKRIEGINPESSPYLLGNLEKWTEYGITVRAQTEAGDGPESLQLLIRTEEDGMFPKTKVLRWSAPLTMAASISLTC